MSSPIRLAIIFVLVSAGLNVPAVQAAEEREFLSGYAGSLPTDPQLKARTYFNNPAVRKLIYVLEGGPVSQADVTAALQDTTVTPEQLIRVRILRRKDDRYYIGFNYFNLDDMRQVHEAADKYVPSLVRAYLRNRQRMTALWQDYPADSVSDEMLAFILIAGFSLNWDALTLTEEKGYRKPQLVKGDDWQYSFWASEAVPERSEIGYYRGSHSFPGGPYNYEKDPVDFSFSSFGDPESSPRMNFPDLFYTPAPALPPAAREIAGRLGFIHETSLGLDLENVLGLDTGRTVGPLLFRLRSKPMSEADLRAALPETGPERLPALLVLLEETQYVERAEGGVYRLIVPALDYGDRRMVEATLAMSRAILSDWLEKHYPLIRRDLSALTSLKHGVPFESLFTEIWHELFGLATRELVASGFMADPRGEDRRYKGSLPTVWRLSLYELQPG